MKKLELIKGGLELLTSIGVGVLAGSAIGLVKPQNLGRIKKIAVGVGGIALSNMAADRTVEYVDEKWDETETSVREFFGKPKPETSEEDEA